ncbi:hypothetical protein THAOC_32552, partial [Thalassiosira oceanica]
MRTGTVGVCPIKSLRASDRRFHHPFPLLRTHHEQVGHQHHGGRRVRHDAPPEPRRLVADVLVHDVPADVLALPAAVVAPKAPDALPPRPPPAEAARPPPPAHAPLLERPAGPAVQGHEGADGHRHDWPEPPPADERRAHLPPGVGPSERREDVRG